MLVPKGLGIRCISGISSSASELVPYFFSCPNPPLLAPSSRLGLLSGGCLGARALSDLVRLRCLEVVVFVLDSLQSRADLPSGVCLPGAVLITIKSLQVEILRRTRYSAVSGSRKWTDLRGNGTKHVYPRTPVAQGCRSCRFAGNLTSSCLPMDVAKDTSGDHGTGITKHQSSKGGTPEMDRCAYRGTSGIATVASGKPFRFGL
jgi:hypothetical protein